MSELRKCPFCGHSAFENTPELEDDWSARSECQDCTAEAAPEDWAKRTPGPATRAMLVYCKAEQAECGSAWDNDAAAIIEAFIDEWEDQ